DSSSTPPAAPDRLVAGASIADGRYRLLVHHGGCAGLQFWQALDAPLNRQVAVTLVDGPADVVGEILTRTLRLSRFDVPGIARLLDVARTAEGGLIVAEWIRGASLKEVADVSPSPLGAARATQALAAAAEVAHRAGLALSIDHPSRLRVSIGGDVVLAFPATVPGSTPQADVQGIGAALYALLVNRWPLPESGLPSGIAPAKRAPDGLPEVPQAINLDIPFPISTLAARAVSSGGGIVNARTLSDGLQRAVVEADRTGPLPAVPPPPEPDRRKWVGPRSVPVLFEQVRGRRRAGLLAGVGAGAVVLIVALVALASVLGRLFGDVNGFDTHRLGLTAPSASQSPSASANRPSVSVKPVAATVFSPGGGADNPGQAGLAIGGDTKTGWSTDTYFDAAPFPSFKSGVGLLLQLPRPAVVTAVGLDVPSTGTQVQIRSSPTANPAALSDTTPLTPPVPVQPGHNRIPVSNAPPTSTVLLWISTLGSTDGQSRSEISNVTVEAAS
ncbi:MAG TPA: protein kinase family protein, partial [Mycobacterium sp.]|nr:protein kinase family protein [Mycobacterium sp.]